MTPQEIEALKAERDALAAHNKILLDALNLALPSVETCYKQHIATWETLFLLREAAKAAPQQCLRDVQAEAISQFAKHLSDSGELSFGDSNFVLSEAHQYAESVRKGSA